MTEERPLTVASILPGHSLYSDDDLRAVADYMDIHAGMQLEEMYSGIAGLLSDRQDRIVTISAAKNVVARGRREGFIPPSERQLAMQASKAKASKATKPKADPKPKVPKPFDPNLSAEDLVDVVCSVLYCDVSSIPTAHLGPVLRFHKHAQEFLDALK